MESHLEAVNFISLQSLYAIQLEFMASYGYIFLMLLVSLYLLYPSIKIKLCERKNNKFISRIGKSQLKNVAIQVSEDEIIYIDYLILLPTGIFVLNVLKYNGIIFAGENVEYWTQLINKKSYKFPNPLQDLDVCESTIRSIVADCNVIGHIAFDSNCEFPKGKPRRISILQEMSNELEFLNEGVDKDLEEKCQEKWNIMKNSDFCRSDVRQNDLSILVKAEQKTKITAIGIFFLVTSLLLLAYQLAGLTWF
ncbi:hypothetical protein MNBD_GAMMA22-1241 [hydrothermal vent metagenome]|uniref:NERD domain-containing protein n=1 Tax=hydrothermal vent metagenome TaxID=652676 RepID=A0A3B0ZTS9_9ZZZZ